MNNKFWGLYLILVTGVILLLGTAIAEAGGTASGNTISNAISPAGGTLPLNLGELGVGYTVGNDSSYRDTSVSLDVNVITAYDLDVGDSGDANQWEAYFQQADTIAAGDTAVFTLWIRNDGNAAYNIHFYHSYNTDSEFYDYRIFADEDGNNQFSLAGDIETGPTLTLAADASGTFFFLVATESDTPDGSFGFSQGFVTDSAPAGYGSLTGDGWQDSAPLGNGENDGEDTFIFSFRTYILGPVMRLSKSISDSSGLRPGDTIEYQIVYDNDGGDTANNVVIVDAIPQYTTFVVGSASDSDPHDSDGTGIVVTFAEQLSQDTFADPEATTIAKLRWTMNTPVSPTEGDDRNAPNFQGVNEDNGRVRFQVLID